MAVETRVRHKEGSWRHLEGMANNLLDDPAVKGMVFNHRDVTDRKGAEEEVRRLNETLEWRIAERTARLAEREYQLKKLVGKLVAAQEEERRRVAREVHDGLTQVLFAAYQHLQAFADGLHHDGPEASRKLNRALELARRAIVEARHLIEGLRPTALDDFGLSAAVRVLVEEFRADGWEVVYQENLGEQRPPADVETTLYRVAQEALTNARKHAKTTKVHVALERTDESVRLRVQDFGHGFDPSAPPKASGAGEKIGLAGMRERVALLGGNFEVCSRPGLGTQVVASIPLPVSDDTKEQRGG